MTSARKYEPCPDDASRCNEKNIDAVSNGNGLTFFDFLPKVLVTGGTFRLPEFENFRSLVDRANEWLRSNQKWKIITCETIEFTTKDNDIDNHKMIYFDHCEKDIVYIRGLRLWVREREEEDEREIQIGYVNVIPHQYAERGFLRPPIYEPLDDLIDRFNDSLHSNPLPGRIITIETQRMEAFDSENFDADCSSWCDTKILREFLFIIRVFYEVTTGVSEEIGVHDFFPDVIKGRGIFTLPEYEPFSNVVNKASEWCSEQRELRFCNVQSLEIQLITGLEPNSMITVYGESAHVSTSYVRILRVAYTKPATNHNSQSERPFPFRQLTCRTFVPVELSSRLFCPAYENLHQTKERVYAWIKATGACVLSVETLALKMFQNGERKDNSEATFSHSKSNTSEFFIFVIRLYLNGAYREPPPEMLPPVPELKTGCCVIL